MENESVSESGKIYRNAVGIFTIVCVHCGNYFDDINETLDHIESHFTDGIIVTDAALENDNKLMERTKFLDFDEMSAADDPEFISITTDHLKIETNDANDAMEHWIEQNSMDNLEDSVKIATIVETTKMQSKDPANKQKTMRCPFCSESFTHQLFLVVHTKTHHPNIRIQDDTHNSAYKCERCTAEFDTTAMLEDHFTENHTVEMTIDLKVDDVSSSYQTDDTLECKVCRRDFRTKNLLKRHVARSTCKDEFCVPLQVGEFPFYCDICGHGFPKKFRLIYHMAQRHTGTETRCKYCNQRYVLETSLQKHETHDCPQRPGAEEDGGKKVVSKRKCTSHAEHDKKTKKNWGGHRESGLVQGPKMFNCEFCERVSTLEMLI